ncbi:MAG: HAD family hydrolase [Erysipelotrichaceae bacterium]|nr:HAD family hydrolase [Erysipelotrichaceae bacterium]
MYGTSGKQLKVVVIELDGCLFSLNQYRFNFYKNQCVKKGLSFTRDQFYPALGSMWTMYDELPLSTFYDSLALNVKVENDLMNYLTLKGLKANEGAKEFLDYCHQKGMKVVAMSTHRTEDAIKYLKKGDIYHKVDYVMGSDTKLKPIPSNEMLTFVLKKYGATAAESIMITSLRSILMTAKDLGMNVIYYKDLVEPTDYERQNSYSIATSFYEALNDMIFGQYEDYSMFETLLGMSDTSSMQDLEAVRYHLQQVYADDSNIMNIVNRTYEYKLSEMSSKPRFVFDDEDEPLTESRILNKGVTRQDIMRTYKDYPVESDEEVAVIQEITPEQRLKVALSESQSSALTDVINQIMSQPEVNVYGKQETNEQKEDDYSDTIIDRLANETIEEETVTTVVEKQEEEEVERPDIYLDHFKNGKKDDEEEEVVITKSGIHLDFKDMFSDSVFVLFVSIFMTFIGAIIYVALIDLFDNNKLGVISTLATLYMKLADAIVGAVISILHVIHLAPSFNNYLNANPVFSPFALHIFHGFILNCIVIVLIETVISMRKSDQ